MARSTDTLSLLKDISTGVFDPTNRRVGSHNLIPVAVGRDIHHIVPVSGSFSGGRGALSELAVGVAVRLAAQDNAAAMEDRTNLTAQPGR